MPETKKREKIVLAYSGGLDTSVAVKWLIDKGYDVICYMADVGQGMDVEPSRKKALEIGAVKCIVDDLRERFIVDYAFRALKAGAMYQGRYNLATALSRPIIAEGMLDTVAAEGARSVAHGCTGKGNDQVRFEVAFHLKAPHVKIMAPVREWELTTRESEIEYAKKHGIPIEQTKEKPYSIDRNLWGVSVEGGVLEDLANEPKEDSFVSLTPADRAPEEAEYVTVSFKSGVPAEVNGRALSPVELVEELNDLGARHGVGRVDMVEDRLVGIKSREIYEGPASAILYEASGALEEVTLDREVRKCKKLLSGKYAELVYNGLWFTPLREALDAFMDSACERVTGEVKIKLYKGTVTAVARKSDRSRYDKGLATYGEGDNFDQSLARGFIELWALPYGDGS